MLLKERIHVLRGLVVACSVFPAFAIAETFDDLLDLQGKTVIYAGEFERFTCPIGGKYDCLTWPTDFFKTTGDGTLCFTTRSYVSRGYSCKGVIAVGEDKVPYVFFLEKLGGDMKKSSLEVYRCPSPYRSLQPTAAGRPAAAAELKVGQVWHL